MLFFPSPLSLLTGVLERDLPPEIQTHTLKVSCLLSHKKPSTVSKEVVKQENLSEASFHTQLNLIIFSFLEKGLCKQRLLLMEDE